MKKSKYSYYAAYGKNRAAIYTNYNVLEKQQKFYKGLKFKGFYFLDEALDFITNGICNDYKICETDDEIWIDKPDSYLDKFFWYKNMTLHYGELKDTLDKDPMTCIVQTPFEYRETKEIETTFNHLKFFVENSDEYLEIATTRPEFLCACDCVFKI